MSAQYGQDHEANNAELLDSFRSDSLDYLLGMSVNVSLDKAA